MPNFPLLRCIVRGQQLGSRLLDGWAWNMRSGASWFYFCHRALELHIAAQAALSKALLCIKTCGVVFRGPRPLSKYNEGCEWCCLHGERCTSRGAPLLTHSTKVRPNATMRRHACHQVILLQIHDKFTGCIKDLVQLARVCSDAPDKLVRYTFCILPTGFNADVCPSV